MPFTTPLDKTLLHHVATDSRGLVAQVTLNLAPTETQFFNLGYLTAHAAGLVIELESEGVTVTLTGTSGTSTLVPQHSIEWSTTVAAPSTVVNVQLTDTGGMGPDKAWTLRARVDDPTEWTLDFGSTAFTIALILCDPIAVLTGVPTMPVPEDTRVDLTALLATSGTVIGTLPGGALPAVAYQFRSTGTVPVMPLPVCGITQTQSIRAPMVYQAATIGLQVIVAYSACGALSTAWLRRTSPTVTLEVLPRTQRMVIVVDRSGSMWGPRWDNATKATRMLMQLFYAFRNGLATEDMLGVVVFENGTCSWGTPSLVPAILPLSSPADVDRAACGLAMGMPGSCTPIGDGLIAGMGLMSGAPAGTRYTLVVVTDGYQNAGMVKIGDGSTSGGIQSFDSARAETRLAAVNAGMSLFTIGLGSTVDEPVLNRLPGSGEAGGRYLYVTDPAQLAEAFEHILSFSQHANPLTISSAGASEVRLTTAAGAEKLGIAVVAPGGIVEVGYRPAGSTGAFASGPTSRSCPDVHAVAVQDVASLSTESLEWRVQHVVGTTPQPQPLSPSDVLAFEDLRVRADVVFDRSVAPVGGTLGLTVHLRDGGEPVTNAKVTVLVDAPAVGVGELLTKYGRRYEEPKDVSGPDPSTGKALMIETVMADLGWTEMPRYQPTGIFVDGTDELHDTDGTGDYRNGFARLDHEGTYTWTLRAEGTDTRGFPFDRVLKVSIWAGIVVDPRLTSITVIDFPKHPSGLPAAEVIVRPVDDEGRPLGPFWDSSVYFSLENAQFGHVYDGEPAPVRYDGTYRRVVLFDPRSFARLRVKAAGARLEPITLNKRRWRPDFDW